MPVPLWFVLALVPMVTSQIVRLRQSDPVAWLVCDYARRCGALLILAAIPAARQIAFERHRLQIAWWKLAVWIVSLVLFDRLAGAWVRRFAASMALGGHLGHYPVLHGWVFAFD